MSAQDEPSSRSTAPSVASPTKRARMTEDKPPADNELSSQTSISIRDMPSDVQGEIASHLPAPEDLIAFSRTSLVLHRALASRHNAAHIWRKVSSTIPGLPPCPPDLNGAAYMALVVLDECSSCVLGEQVTVISAFSTFPSTFMPALKIGELIRVQGPSYGGAYLTADYKAMKAKLYQLAGEPLAVFIKLRRAVVCDARRVS
ncbi:hypothetical protein C8R43DRAFT_1148484 [Mycena crocata]|nr:hypothetical protein C8R43DRAFT_1148484 [Mycena crocata]